MTDQKQTYLLRIRSESAYPWVRSLATFVGFIFYTLAFMLSALSIVIGGVSGKIPFFLGVVLSTLVVSVLLILAGHVLKEAMVMLADIADSVTDLNCRYEQ